MTIGGLGLAFLAGLLTVLSPCVLPLLPLVFGSAATGHRLGPLAIGAGVALSFTTIGLFIAIVGYAIGIDADVVRFVAAVLFILIGAVLLVPAFEARLAFAGGPISDWTERRFGSQPGSARGPFALGLLLGAVWVPCVGPTIGAASLLAAKGEQVGSVALTMLVFGIGAATPLVLLGLASRQALLAWRGRMVGFGRTLKLVLGAVMVTIGVLTLSGYDHVLEAALVEISPDWLTELTTRY